MITVRISDGQVVVDVGEMGSREVGGQSCAASGKEVRIVVGDDHRIAAARPLPAPPVRAPAPPSRAQPFSGGELVIHPGFVTLCGVKVISDKGTGQSKMILEQLRKTGPGGKRVAFSAEELADNIGATDVQVITGCIKTLRKNIKERLHKHRRLVVGDQDVVAHSEQGYRLREWIAVRNATAEEAEQPGDAK